jgi:hypothetical protein
MAQLRLDLDQETFERLVEVALQERRPVVWQAEVLLRQALGLPFPYSPIQKGGRGGPSVCRVEE